VLDAVGEKIFEALRSHAVDVAFSVGDNLTDMVARPLFNDRLALICARDHALAVEDIVRWEQLGGAPVIAMARGTTIRSLTDSAAATAGVRLNITLEPQLVPSALAFAKAGLGMAILPSSMVSRDPGLVALTLAEPEILRTISLLYPGQYPLPPAPAAFCEHAARAAKDLTFGE
jgi:LysR family carnitine catabolism transcriptional activator